MSWIEHGAAIPASRPIAAAALSLVKTLATGRWHWFRYDRRGWWTNRQSGLKFFSPTIHTSTLGHLMEQVEYLWCYRQPIGPGDVVVDVGAGVGDHVLVVSRMVGPSGRVIAVEAHPATARCLERTVAHNKLQNTVVVEGAAWDTEAELLISDAATHEQNAVVGTSGTVPIRARPLDAILAPLALPRIDLLKMNIEGAELKALAGMPHALAHVKAVVISCHDFLATEEPTDPRRTKGPVTALLQEAGFDVTSRPSAPTRFAVDYVYGVRQVRDR